MTPEEQIKGLTKELVKATDDLEYALHLLLILLPVAVQNQRLTVKDKEIIQRALDFLERKPIKNHERKRKETTV